MVEMQLNSNPIEVDQKDPKTINEVMDFIQENFAKDNEFFTDVKVDGVSITQDREEELLDTKITSYRKIEFTVKNSIELAFDALNTCSGHVDNIIEKIKEVSELYRANKIEKANYAFIEITETLDLFIELITNIHHSINAEVKLTGGILKTIKELEMHLLSVLKALVPAKEKGDIIMLCDLLEYELIDNLTQWKINAIPELKKLKTA